MMILKTTIATTVIPAVRTPDTAEVTDTPKVDLQNPLIPPLLALQRNLLLPQARLVVPRNPAQVPDLDLTLKVLQQPPAVLTAIPLEVLAAKLPQTQREDILDLKF